MPYLDENREFQKVYNQSELSKEIGWGFIYSGFFQIATFWRVYNCIQELWIYWIRMSILKIKIYKRVLKDVSEKYEGAEEFINSRIEEICFQEKLSVDFYLFLLAF